MTFLQYIYLETLEGALEVQETTAYGVYLMDIGLQGDTMKLLVALLACLLGYGEVGLWLKSQADTWALLTDANPYHAWVNVYAGREYQDAVKFGLELIEARAAQDVPSPVRFEEWREVWEWCTMFEKVFWDVGLRAAGMGLNIPGAVS